MPRLTLFLGVVALALLALAGSASAATYFVTQGGSDADPCTAAQPCATVQHAIEQHRLAPQPDDVIDVGPGTFEGNFAADDPDDDGLTIRGTLNGGTRQTTLRGEDFGADDSGIAFPVGGCGGAEVRLRDANVDTVGADPVVMALELDGGSDLFNVHASNQPGSMAFAVVLTCERGSEIQRSEIAATDDVSAIGVFDTARLLDSTATAEGDFPTVVQFSGGDPSPELRIRRSRVSLAEDSLAPAVVSTTRLTVDSSLVTGGAQGVQTLEGVEWLINNSTIDAGVAGVSDPANTPSLSLDPFFASADVTADSSILVDGIQGLSTDDGDGTLSCDHSDLPSVSLDPTWTDDCPIGGGSTNTTTPPADLFVGGAPYDWMLKATSPAIDTGQPGAVPAGLAIRDLAGNPRRAAGTTATCPDGTRDKGAYEFVGPPCAIQPPEILNGDAPVPGDVLSSNRGTWTDAPTGHLRQWLRCDPDGDNCTEVTDYRTRKNYRVRRPDVGSTLRVRVIATNNAGDSEPATSDPSGLVSDPP